MAYDDSTPYILDEPARIAMKYGGNKQKIRRAIQMGLEDPTAALLAGMFVDQMRNAQALEQAPQQTVAEQTFAPPVAAAPQMPMDAGLGATPQAQQLGAAMPPAPPAAPAMPTQMAAEGGLMGLNVPEDMYEYSNGGIVAFAAGDAVKSPNPYIQQIQDMYSAIPESEEEKAYRAYLQGLPGSARQRRQEGMWEAVALGGLTAAAQAKPTTGNVLQDIVGALGTAGAAGLPAMTAAGKEARAEEAAALKGQAELARGKRQEQIGAIKEGTALFNKELDRQAQITAANIAAGKQTDMKYYADQKLKAQKGDKEAATIVAAIETYLPLAGLGRVGVAQQQATIAGQKFDLDLYDKANEFADNQVGFGGSRRTEYTDLQKQDRENAKKGTPTNLAADFKKNIRDEYIANVPKVSGQAQPGAAAPKKPEISGVTGAPEGSSIGQFVSGKGWEVKDKSGKVIGYAQQ